MFDNYGALRKTMIAAYVVMTVGAMAFFPFKIAFSVVLGGVLALGNFAYLERYVKMTLGQEHVSGAGRFLTSILYYSRFFIMLGALYIFTEMEWLNYVALAVGLSLTVVSIFAWFAISLGKGHREEKYERAY